MGISRWCRPSLSSTKMAKKNTTESSTRWWTLNNSVVPMVFANNIYTVAVTAATAAAAVNTFPLSENKNVISLVPANRRDVIRTYYYLHIIDRWGAYIVFRQRTVGCNLFSLLKNGWSLSSSHQAIMLTNTLTHSHTHNDKRTLFRTQHFAEQLTNDNNEIMCTIWIAVGRCFALRAEQSWFHEFVGDFPQYGFFLMVFLRQYLISHDVSMDIESTHSTSLLSIFRDLANDFWYFSPAWPDCNQFETKK